MSGMYGVWRLLAAVLLLLRPSLAQEPVRVADASCARCHRAIVERYLRTPMANASGRATEHLLPGTFAHGRSGVQYSISADKEQAYFSFTDSKDPRIHGRRPLAYFLGSGHLGVTYLYEQEGYLLETPVAWYAASGGYDMKPGFGQMSEMPMALPMSAECLRCHMSGVRPAVAGSLSRYAGAPFAQTGITCESCHGDTAAHVQSGGKAAVTNPAKLDAERRDSICISCHLEGDVTVKRAGHTPLDYRPGDRIGDFLAYFVYAGNDPLSRGVSEVEQLAASGCKRASGDRMSCTTCHDPHGSEYGQPEAERVAFYRSKCLNCHSAPTFAQTHHPEAPDCTGCHMPRSSAQDVPHVAWTDHRILRQTAGTPTLPAGNDLALLGPGQAPPAKTLTAIFSPEADARDRAMARYTAVMAGLSQDRNGALAALRKAYIEGARDTRLLEALGVLNAFTGDAAESEARLRELLAKDPTDLTALSDLGIFLARKGDLEAAVAMWQRAFARNGDDLKLARNLALTQCALGKNAEAQQTMAAALQLSPGSRAAWDFACESGPR